MAYARDVLAGRIVVGVWAKKACARQLRDLERARKDPAWSYRWDVWHANDVCDFIEKLPHVEGTWKTKTIHLEPVQVFLLTTIFGWRRRADGGRRFSVVYIEAARKFAKSTLTAAVILYCLTCEGENGPKIIVGATTGAQAQKVFDPAHAMVTNTKALRDAFGLTAWSRSITCNRNNGFIQTINAKSSTQDGWNLHVGVLDELHAHKDQSLYDVIRSAFGSRANPLLWMITTAGYNDAGICYDRRTFTTQILEQTVEADHFFGVIFTVDEGDDIFNEACWPKANPMIGITPTWTEMRGYAAEAKNSTLSLAEFKTKRCNVWTGAALAWINLVQWDACDDPEFPIAEARLVGRTCYGGLDLASVSDLIAWVLSFPDEEDPEFLDVLARFWVPEEQLKRSPHKDLYRRWVAEKWLTATPGAVADYAFIRKQILDDAQRFHLVDLNVDWLFQGQQLSGELMDEGLTLFGMRQGHLSYAAPMKSFERRLIGGALNHGGNPVLRWMAGNLIVRIDEQSNVKPDRKKSKGKIDGMVALAMSVDRVDRNLSGENRSAYEDGDVEVV